MMSRRVTGLSAGLLVAGAALLLLPFAAGAAGLERKAGAGTPALLPDETLDFQCWQEGQKIIDESGLKAMQVSKGLSDRTLSFQRASEGDQRIIIVSIGRSLCMAKTTGR